MITHGTQKITDLRRGTWRITSMTRGTFDILGLFSSPYSKAATIALQEQFPTQWETIRQYGWDHPEIVPYVNEDYLFVCSLGLPGMPIRWLVGDGTAYFRTGIFATQNTNVTIKAFKSSRTDNTKTSLFVVDDGANQKAFGVGRWNQKIYGWYGTEIGISYSLPAIANMSYYYHQDRGHTIIENENGGKVDVNKTLSGSIYYGEFAFPATSRSGNFYPGLWDTTGIIFHNEDVEFAPFITNRARAASECYPQVVQAYGAIGMINLKTGLFHPNANSQGSFTIEYTLPDGTPWTPPAS